MTPLLRSRSVWILCLLGWTILGAFVVVRDLMVVGPNAPGLRRDELLPFVESIVLWGFLSPLIIALCERLSLQPGSRVRSFALHAMWALVICAGDVVCDALFSAAADLKTRPLLDEFYDQLFLNVFSYVAVAGAGYAVIYARALARSQVRSAELERELTQARLDALTRRLQPHFLFNSLNSIAALIRLADSEKALAAVVALGDLLRVVLAAEGDARVPLEQELDWVERYLRMERLRFESRLATEVHADPSIAKALVPALVLQPFVENAIRHGVERFSGPAIVSIAAERNGEYLQMTVRNAAPQRPSSDMRAGFGVGLGSTRERLAHLYGSNRFALDVATLANETTATIRIPYAMATP